MKLKDIAYDPKASVEGVWVEYPGTNIRCLTGRMFNPEMVEWVDRMTREHTDPITGQVPEDTVKELTFEATIRFVCKDWENVEDENDEPIAFSEETARVYFRERKSEYGHFYNWWLQQAERRELFLAKNIHDQAKKSVVSSNGSGIGETRNISS